MLALTAAAPARPTATMDAMVMSRVRPENHPAGLEGCGVFMASTYGWVDQRTAKSRQGFGKGDSLPCRPPFARAMLSP